MLWFIRAQPAIYPEQFRAVPAAVAVCRLHANADESQLNWKKKTKNWNWISFLKWAKQNEMKWNKWVTPHCACSNCKALSGLTLSCACALLCVRSLAHSSAIGLRVRLGDKVWHCSHTLTEYASRESAPWRTSACSIADLHCARRSLVLTLSHSPVCNWPAPQTCCDVALSLLALSLPELSRIIWMKRRAAFVLPSFTHRICMQSESGFARSIARLRSLCLSVRATSQSTSTPTGRSLVAHMRKRDGTMRTYA